jgi:hypothetical protein
MKRITNPRVEADCPMAGEPGHAPGHVHASCPTDGLTFQCVQCHEITTYPWDAIEAENEEHLRLFPHADTVRLPTCECGAQAFLNHSNVEYGLELPHHYTLKAVREHIAPRLPALQLNRHAEHERFQGHDFSHLPAKERPPHHEAYHE